MRCRPARSDLRFASCGVVLLEASGIRGEARGWAAALAFLSVVLAGPAASAQVAPARVVIDADPACVDERAFLAAVRAQTPNLQSPPPEGAARRLSIQVTRAGKRLVGTLRVDEIDGTGSSREVTARGCAELVSALALVTALAVDAGPSLPTPPAPQTPLAPTAPPAALAPLPIPTPAPAPPSRDAPPPPPNRASSPMRFGVGSQGLVMSAVAPQPAWGVVPFVDWSRWGRSGLAPSLRAAVAIAAGTEAQTATGTASFRWVAARVTGCPVALVLASVTARPCVGFDAGALRGSGANLTVPFVAERAWLAPLLSARIQWNMVRWLAAEAEAGAFVPLVRTDFAFQYPSVDVYQVPAVGGFAALGLGVLVP